MNAGPTTTRVYEALRQRLMERAYAPGTRLEPQSIAQELASSTTPVRDALHVLAGEDLVVLGSHGGFSSATIDEPSLVDLYAWNSAVLQLALRDHHAVAAEYTGQVSGPLAERTGALFQAIADNSANIEHGRAMRRIDARLHAAREIEVALLPDADSEFDVLENSYANGDLAILRRHLAKYTRRRQQVAANVVRALYRDLPAQRR